MLGDQLHIYPDAYIGMAVALEGGLIVPVIHMAGAKSLFQVGAEIEDLSRRARDGKLKAASLSLMKKVRPWSAR